MLRGNRILILAIGVVAVIATVIAVLTWPTTPLSKSYSYESPRSKGYSPGGSKCEPSALATIRDGIKRASETDACREKAEQYRLDTNDLIQQTRAADAAKAQAEIASQGLWTAWFQTIGGFITLAAAIGAAIYARDAARETRRGADAADKSLRFFVDVERARITAEPVGVHPYADHIVMASLRLSNAGRSTATIIECRSDMLNGVQFPDHFPVSVRIDRGIKADETFSVGGVPIDTRKFPEFCFVGGYVEYRTAFGQTLKSYFLARIEEPNDSSYWTINPTALYCGREERQRRFGWPPDQ